MTKHPAPCSLIALCLAMTACNFDRPEGDLEVVVEGLDRSVVTAIDVEIRQGESAHLARFPVAELAEDAFSIRGLLEGQYRLTAVGLDASEQRRQKGVSRLFLMEKGKTTSITLAMHDIEVVASCTPQQVRCDSDENGEFVAECVEGSSWETVESCDKDESCQEGECRAGAADGGVGDASGTDHRQVDGAAGDHAVVADSAVHDTSLVADTGGAQDTGAGTDHVAADAAASDAAVVPDAGESPDVAAPADASGVADGSEDAALDPCLGESCSGRVSCVVETNQAVCHCPSNFAGLHCEDCATGYAGPSCLACTCANGTCDDGFLGDGQCTSCVASWAGPDCDIACTCVNGTCDQGILGDGHCASCTSSHFAGVDCDSCSTAYTGTSCDSCASGYTGYPNCTPDDSLDLDHDGVCASVGCAVNATDTCPTVWNPDNDPTVCPDLDAGFTRQRAVTLMENGGPSTSRRTYEPVEIPLANGIIDDSVVALWRLDGDFTDARGNASAGVIVGDAMPGTGAFGASSTSMHFDGTGDGASISSAHGMNFGTGDFSISFWMRHDDLPVSADANDEDWIWCYRPDTGTDTGICLILVPYSGLNGQVWLWIQDEAANHCFSPLFHSGVAVDDGKWHHIAFVRTNTRQVVAYTDGILTASTEMSRDCSINNTGSEAHFSCNSPSPCRAWSGELDEFAVWDRALSPTELSAQAELRQPLGTTLVPGAQADLDDIRVTEAGSPHSSHVVPYELLGPRPHSDTPCATGSDDGTWSDRDDLCGVAAYWRLDGDATDVLGGANGTVTGAGSRPGRFGVSPGAMHFDGIDDGIDMPATAALSFGVEDSFTVEAWFRTNSFEQQVNIVRLNYEPAGNVEAFIGISADKPDFFVRGASNPGNPTHCSGEGIVANDGNWHHIAGVRSRVTATISMYWDGVRVCGPVSEDQPGGFGGKHFVIGYNGISAETRYSEGTVDEVLVHRVAKSPDYIYRRARPGVPAVRFLANTEPVDDGSTYDWMQYSMHWGKADAQQVAPLLTALDRTTHCVGLLSPCTGYAGWWRLDEGSGVLAIDSSSRRHHGALAGPSVPQYSAGRSGTALDIAAGWVEVADANHLDFGTSPFTAEVAFSSTQSSFSDNFAFLVSKTDCSGGSGGFMVGFDADSATSWLHNASPDRLVDNQGAWNDGEWHAARSVRGAAELNFSVDQASGTADLAGAAAISNSSPLHFGRGYDQSCNYARAYQGLLDSIRLMSRALQPDEFLHYPTASWSLGLFQDEAGLDLDQDSDGVLNDGDGSLAIGDHPCTGGETTGCDDNCPNLANPGQEDTDSDGIGDICEMDILSRIAGRIVFTGNQGGTYQAYVLTLGESSPLQITTIGNIFAPSWDKTDGTVVYSESYGPIHRVQADGSGDLVIESNIPRTRTTDVNLARKIVTAEDHDGNYTLWTMDGDGANQQAIYNGGDNQLAPIWSPDGTKVAWCSDKYSCTRGIRIANADGSGNYKIPGLVLSDWGQLSWSPDGTRIAYANVGHSCWSQGPTSTKIFAVEAKADGAFTQLTFGPGNHSAPEWIDNDTLLYVSDEDGDNDLFLLENSTGVVTKVLSLAGNQGNPRFLGTGIPRGALLFNNNQTGYYELYHTAADGSDLVQVTYDNAHHHGASWTADGSAIVYTVSDSGSAMLQINKNGTGGSTISTARTDFFTPDVAADGRIVASLHLPSGGNIWTMGPAGENATSVYSGGDNQLAPIWSPDASKIAWVSDKYSCSRGIRIADPDGTNSYKIAGLALYDWGQISWSPDGTRIAFSHVAHSCWPEGPALPKIFIVEAKPDGAITQVTFGAGSHFQPDWLDNSHLFYSSDEDGDFDIYLTDLSGAGVRRITNLPGNEHWARFFPSND